MGGVEDTRPHSANDKHRTKMSLCKLLTQRKAKVGCFKTESEEESGGETIANSATPLASPSRSRHNFRGSLNRGYSDPESRTTRLSLCCAMTESSSRTPPHTHQFQLTPHSNDDDEAQIVHTKDSESQTTNSNPGTPVKRSKSPDIAMVERYERYDKIMHDSTNGRSRVQSPQSRPSSCPSSPVKFADDASTDTSPSTPSYHSDVIPRKVLSLRLSADNLLVSPTSPTASVLHSSPDSLRSVPERAERRRRSSSHDTLKENRANARATVACEDEHISMDSLARQALLAAQVLHLIPTDKARERNFLHGRIAANSLLGPTELERVLPEREIKVFVGTWNMNGQAPPTQLNDFMLPDGLEHVPDIISIGTQESYPERFDWEVKIQETIGPSHVLFHSTTLGTLHLAVFIRRDLLWFCSVPEESSLSVRPGTAFRTKGAVAIAFILFGTSFLFITAHLTAHQEKVKERVHDIKRIVRLLDLPKSLPIRHRMKSKDVTQNFDNVFWCGDLNFRLAQPREDVMQWVEEYKFPLLVDLKSDQLTKVIIEGTCLSTFEEGSITFPPTYKYDPGTQNFDTSSKQRTPAYTDRILFKGRGGRLSCVAYSSVPNICTSDHKPVWGVYKTTIRPGIDTIPLAAGLFNREVYLEGIKRRAAEIERRELGLSAVCSLQ